MREIEVSVGSCRIEPLVAAKLVFAEVLRDYPFHVQAHCSTGSDADDPLRQSLERLRGLSGDQAHYTLAFGSKVYPGVYTTHLKVCTLIRGPSKCLSVGMRRIEMPRNVVWQAMARKELRFVEIPVHLYRDTIIQAMVPHLKNVCNLEELLR